MNTLAVVGPGLMGLGISQVAAAAGCAVRLLGRNAASTAAARQRLALNWQRQVERGRIDHADAAAALARVQAVESEAELDGCCIVI